MYDFGCGFVFLLRVMTSSNLGKKHYSSSFLVNPISAENKMTKFSLQNFKNVLSKFYYIENSKTRSRRGGWLLAASGFTVQIQLLPSLVLKELSYL